MNSSEEPPFEDLLERGLSSAFEIQAEGHPEPSDPADGGGRLVWRAPASPPPVPDRLGPFAVSELIGMGGMGLVYKAQDAELGRQVAIKVLHQGFEEDPDLLRRFEAEARVCSRLEHPGVVPLHRLGRLEDGRPFFSMKLVEGETLAVALEKRGDLQPARQEFLDIFLKVCQTVAYAHAQGILHRDLKPSNIMLGSFGEVLVMDWGLASASGQALLNGQGSEAAPSWGAGRIAGTPAYMAPEQARGDAEHTDKRSDVFSLGAILCEILTGQPPYISESRSEAFLQASKAWLDDAWSRLESSPADPWLLDLARRCLDPDPAQRPCDGGAVALETSSFLTSRAARARSLEIEAAQARAKAAEERRNRRLTLTLALVILAGLLLAGGSYLWYQNQRRFRLAATDRLVAAALEQAGTLRGEARRGAVGSLDKWSEAVAAGERALGLVLSRQGGLETTKRVRAFLAKVKQEKRLAETGRALIERLLEIRPHLGDERSPKRQDQDYALAFREAGIDVDGLPVAEAARRIRLSAVSNQLVGALDDWAHAREHLGTAFAGRAHKLWRVATLSDTDPWRNELRRAWQARDLKRLVALASAQKTAAMPAQSLDLLAKCLSEAGDVERAIAVYRQAHWSHPGDFWINHNLASLLRKTNSKDKREVTRLFAMAAAARPTSVHVLADLAHAFIREGDYRRAEHDLARIESMDPTYPYVAVYRGYILFRQGHFAAATAAFQKALALDGQIFEAWHFGSWSWLREGRPQEAEHYARRALAFNPNHADANLALGMALASQGRTRAASQVFKRCTELAPNNLNGWYNLGNTLQVRNLLVSALKAYHRALKIAPDSAETLCNLGVLRLRAGRFQEAVALLQRGDKLGRAHGSAWPYSSGQWLEEAQTCAAWAQRLDEVSTGKNPSLKPGARVWLARTAAFGGRPLLAARQFAQVFAENPALASQWEPSHAYVAGCAALAAGLGRGPLARKLQPKARTRWRSQALNWLKIARAALRTATLSRPWGTNILRTRLEGWTHEPVLQAVLGARAKENLPPEERPGWRELWATLRSMARGEREADRATSRSSSTERGRKPLP